MPNTTNYSFPTPADTDLVKDGAAAIRNLGNAVDSTLKTQIDNTVAAAIPKTIVDAKGDLIAATASDTVSRLAVGTNGQYLSADSTAATGLAWVSATGWNPDYQLLNAGGTSLSGSSVTISGISAKNSLYVYWTGLSTTGNHTIYLRLNSDTGNNYTTCYFGTAIGNGFTNPSSYFNILRTGDQSYSHTGFAQIDGTNATGLKLFSSQNTSNDDGSAQITIGRYVGTSTISSITVLPSAGTFDAGTIFVYGA
jgi:hypothetical protein